LIYGNKAVVTTYNEDKAYMYDLNTGQQLMVKDFGYPNTYRPSWSADGVLVAFDSVYRQLHGYDFETLNELWVTEPLSYPWGSNVRYPTWAYGNFYVAVYDGYVYCYDENTGVLKWRFYCGNTTETVFNSYVPFLGSVSRPVLADGKAYIATSEHTPTQPRIRFNRLFCIDAYTGKEIWNISGAIYPEPLAEGYIVGSNENDGVQYCFGKGKTETTVMVGPKFTAKGSSAVIEGSVLDMSPAQPGTPAISDEDMSAWMNYIHMQKPEPMGPEGFSPDQPVDLEGVPVKLTAIKADGSTIDVGTVTSDMDGFFKKFWTPPDEGEYTIVAEFLGSQSYWPSSAKTALGVGPAPSADGPIQPEPTPEPTPQPLISTEVAIVVAVAVIAVIGVVSYWILRKRK
jgi:outer membrane protein assembly factor BamB